MASERANEGPCGVRVEEVSEDELRGLVAMGFKGYTRVKTLIRVYPGRILLLPRYLALADRLKNFEFRKDDIVVMTYPKCGTTWMQELVWGLTRPGNLRAADSVPLNQRSFFLEVDILTNLEAQLNDATLLERFRAACGEAAKPEDGIILQMTQAAPTHSPRVIKTHLTFPLLNCDLLDKCKVIYVTRDARDACVSYHHHNRLISTYQYEGTFHHFAHAYMDGDVIYGDQWDHTASAWARRHHPNLHIVSYEALQQDINACLAKIVSFLRLQLSDSQIREVAEHADFSNMKTRDSKAPLTFSGPVRASEGSFYRKGGTGGWKAVATHALTTTMNSWIEKRSKEAGFSLPLHLG